MFTLSSIVALYVDAHYKLRQNTRVFPKAKYVKKLKIRYVSLKNSLSDVKNMKTQTVHVNTNYAT